MIRYGNDVMGVPYLGKVGRVRVATYLVDVLHGYEAVELVIMRRVKRICQVSKTLPKSVRYNGQAIPPLLTAKFPE